MLINIVGALVFIVLGTLMLVNGDLPGWCLTLVGVALLIAGILGWRDDKPRVTIASTGIAARGVSENEIPWQQVQSARLETIPRGGSFIVLDLIDGKTQRFHVEGLEVREGVILHMIRKRIPEETQPK
jgi:hypothetical protein